jgi:hypothetical protein
MWIVRELTSKGKLAINAKTWARTQTRPHLRLSMSFNLAVHEDQRNNSQR